MAILSYVVNLELNERHDCGSSFITNNYLLIWNCISGSILDPSVNVLLSRLRGLCDDADCQPETFHDQEIVFVLKDFSGKIFVDFESCEIMPLFHSIRECFFFLSGYRTCTKLPIIMHPCHPGMHIAIDS